MIRSIDWKIVVIDDEEDIRDVISVVLSDAGYEVATAENGEEGLRICDTFSPQIVLTDIRMPKMDGIQVLEALKSTHPDIEVIVLTAFGEIKQATRALELDASDYITKPLSDDVLFIALKRAQNRYLSRQQIKKELSSGVNQKAQQIARSISFQENLVLGAIDGALACDENETIISLNSAMAKMLDLPEETEVSRPSIVDHRFQQN
jgi:DNA-binding NtrC family response regulator